jgi:hypothetical protein
MGSNWSLTNQASARLPCEAPDSSEAISRWGRDWQMRLQSGAFRATRRRRRQHRFSSEAAILASGVDLSEIPVK